MSQPFSKLDVLAVAVIAALALLCFYYGSLDSQVEGSTLRHLVDTSMNFLKGLF